MIPSLFIAFVGGLMMELTAVFWVHHTENRAAEKAGLVSCVQATAMVFGLGETYHSGYPAAAFIVGYGAGTYIGIKYLSDHY